MVVVVLPKIVQLEIFGRFPAEIPGEGLVMRQVVVDLPPDDAARVVAGMPVADPRVVRDLTLASCASRVVGRSVRNGVAELGSLREFAWSKARSTSDQSTARSRSSTTREGDVIRGPVVEPLLRAPCGPDSDVPSLSGGG